MLVAGCGAIGSVFACLLAEAGHSVSILGRVPVVEAARRDGLSVVGLWGEHSARVAAAETRPERLGRDFDAVLITCKSYQTEGLIEELGDRAGDRGCVISLQNGLGNLERLMSAYGRDRVLGGRVIFGAELVTPGRARVTVEAEPVLVGALAPSSAPLAERWAEAFDRAGIPSRATDDIEAALWAKVLYNAALNPLGALLGVPYGELPKDRDRRWVMDRAIEEAFAVAAAEGVRLPWASAAEYRKLFYERLVPATAAHRSSMLQDLERGKPTEIDAICGEVCRRGESHGIDTPVNRVLALLVRERSRLGQQGAL